MSDNIDIPDFDPELMGRHAIEINGICHATVTTYTDDGHRKEYTNCGINIEDNSELSILDGADRHEFLDLPMCEECWPDEIL